MEKTLLLIQQIQFIPTCCSYGKYNSYAVCRELHYLNTSFWEEILLYLYNRTESLPFGEFILSGSVTVCGIDVQLCNLCIRFVIGVVLELGHHQVQTND